MTDDHHLSIRMELLIKKIHCLQISTYHRSDAHSLLHPMCDPLTIISVFVSLFSLSTVCSCLGNKSSIYVYLLLLFLCRSDQLFFSIWSKSIVLDVFVTWISLSIRILIDTPFFGAFVVDTAIATAADSTRLQCDSHRSSTIQYVNNGVHSDTHEQLCKWNWILLFVVVVVFLSLFISNKFFSRFNFIPYSLR